MGQGVGVQIRSWRQGVGVWIRSRGRVWECGLDHDGQGMRVWIRSWGQGGGVD